ncbi:MAG: hypothetical protein AAF493_10835 [Pseudomonadota bacterium]
MNVSTRSAQLSALLARVAKGEHLTHQIYGRIVLSGRAEQIPGLIACAGVASLEDEKHYRSVLSSLSRLASAGAGAPAAGDSVAWFESEDDSLTGLLRLVRRIEGELVRVYSEICALSLEFDYRVFDLAFCHLHDNAAHEGLLRDVLDARERAGGRPNIDAFRSETPS